MTASVGIVTDTVACLPASQASALGLGVVPVHLLIGGRDILDGAIDPGERHDRIATGEEASTASPSPGEFLNAFREMAGRGHGAVLAATVSGALSNVYNAARIAADSSPVPVTVIDTRTVASAQGLIVRRLAEMAMDGSDIEELTSAFTHIRARTGLLAAVPDLSHLSRTGRVPKVVAGFGDRLDLKPLIEVRDDGKAHPAGFARSMERAVARLVDRAAAAAGPGRPRLVVMHSLAVDTAAEMANTLAHRIPAADVDVAEFTPVMGIHTGPGLLGVAWEREPSTSG